MHFLKGLLIDFLVWKRRSRFLTYFQTFPRYKTNFFLLAKRNCREVLAVLPRTVPTVNETVSATAIINVQHMPTTNSIFLHTSRPEPCTKNGALRTYILLIQLCLLFIYERVPNQCSDNPAHKCFVLYRTNGYRRDSTRCRLFLSEPLGCHATDYTALSPYPNTMAPTYGILTPHAPLDSGHISFVCLVRT